MLPFADGAPPFLPLVVAPDVWLALGLGVLAALWLLVYRWRRTPKPPTDR